MSIVLYKEGNTHNVRGIRCITQKFEGHVDFEVLERNGWVKSPEMISPDTRGSDKISPEIDSEGSNRHVEAKTQKEEYSDEAIRQIAKNAGIENYGRKWIRTLKKELGLAE